jgi:hypothetical protein
MRSTEKCLLEYPKSRDHLEDQGKDEKIILNYILIDSFSIWAGFIELGTGTSDWFLWK